VNLSKPHPQQQRENPEPYERTNQVPWFVVALTSLIFVVSVVYIAYSDIANPSFYGDGRSVTELQGPAQASKTSLVDGAAIFATRCVACHQSTGLGLPGVFPPLAGSEWVTGKGEMLAALVLHGINGPLTVKGVNYAGAMPAFGAQLQDSEIAAVITHIRSQWGNSAPAVTGEAVAAARKETASRTEPFKGDADLGPLR
jgi:mono/diheme cytochrome c family protein